MKQRSIQAAQSPSPLRPNAWTLGLAMAGLITCVPATQAEEAANQVLTALSSTTLSGYVETSAIWKPGTGGGPLYGRSFDGADKVDNFNLHVVRLNLEKPLEEGQWSAGYKAELAFGPDANYFGGTTLNGGGSVNFDDFAIKQAHVLLRAPVGNGIDFKVGVFDTCIGYEVFDSGSNPNFSRSYGYALEPVTHTGVMASYAVSDVLSFSAGVADTWFGAINEKPADGVESHKTYLGLVSIVLPEAAGPLTGTAIYAGVVDGMNGVSVGANSKDTTSYYAGVTLPTPLTGLTLGGAFDYRQNGLNTTTPGDNWVWATALYASYQATEKVKFNVRGDLTKGSDGTFYDAGAPGSDTQNELFSLTGTLDYSLWQNVITRAEVRWDHSLQGDSPFSNADENAVTVAANIIYKF
ncbi:MAG: outer membrane beta-barrel protein [Verrucomicrobiota bacterium]